MHDIHHPAAADHTARLAAALHAEVARVEPEPRLDDVLDAAHGRAPVPTWAVVLVATVLAVGALLSLYGLLLIAAEREPAPSSPSPTTRLLEA